MVILSEKILDELLEYLEKSVKNLARDAINNIEFQNSLEEHHSFISNQFDIRLENLLQSKQSSIHHLESGMKNKIIQKKKNLLEDIKNNQF